ncbi:hypothetical protein FSP39_019046 [Pinctada imbricata]|uniref:Integrase SAM-like N-terminal domain-containing protein n=1 Tax=Pinctada imbricata TaxID=66713 RepID=A0AA88YF45_PINIB|nr:hypothetical protein FSP39_019046 [Pinctada imbricata]
MDAETKRLIQVEIQNTLTDSQNTMMTEIKNLITSEMSSMQRQNQAIADKQLSKIEESLTDTYKFKKRGNKEQFKHNKKVLSKLKEADDHLAAETDRLSEHNVIDCREALSQGIGLDKHLHDVVEDSGVVEGSYLHSLAGNMCDHLLCSRSENTCKSYSNGFKKWQRFISAQGHSALPAHPVHIALYLTHLLDSGASSNTVNLAVYCIKWVHGLNGYSDPTDNSFVKNLQESAKRRAKPKTCRKDPVTPEMLIKLCEMFKSSSDLGSADFGLHSMRSGGATQAANASLSVGDRCLKRHGRWKTDSSKDRYIADSVEKRLEVSKRLGI